MREGKTRPRFIAVQLNDFDGEEPIFVVKGCGTSPVKAVEDATDPGEYMVYKLESKATLTHIAEVTVDGVKR